MNKINTKRWFFYVEFSSFLKEEAGLGHNIQRRILRCGGMDIPTSDDNLNYDDNNNFSFFNSLFRGVIVGLLQHCFYRLALFIV